jgi:hypothetical protein
VAKIQGCGENQFHTRSRRPPTRELVIKWSSWQREEIAGLMTAPLYTSTLCSVWKSSTFGSSLNVFSSSSVVISIAKVFIHRKNKICELAAESKIKVR